VRAGTPVATVEARQWATFFLGGDVFGFPVSDVQEVLKAQPLTPIPLAPRHVVGLLSLRGEIMSAIDLRRLFGCAERAESEPRKLLILRATGRSVALVVDNIGDVLSLPTEGWRTPPETLGQVGQRFVVGIHSGEGRVLVGLQAQAVLAEDSEEEGAGTAG
jgi:purine-binding chemotaxis protein CheW